MIQALAASILKRPIQIGQSTIPLGLIPWLIGCFAVVIILNGIYLNRYRRIMTYLEKNHPDIYERVRRKPDIGPFYSTGHNPSKALIALAKQVPTLNDPYFEKMLFNFIEFDKKFNIFCSVAVIAMLLSILVISLILTS